MVRRRFLPAIYFLLAGIVGCSGSISYAPVSGIVSIDGKPYGNAVVSFQPVGTKENPNPGRGSSAYTDENGKFVLKSDKNNGAVIGRHLVRIMTKGNNVIGQEKAGGSDDGPVNGKIERDPIPPEWNALSTKEFDVPAGGTDKANFDIISRKPTGKK